MGEDGRALCTWELGGKSARECVAGGGGAHQCLQRSPYAQQPDILEARTAPEGNVRFGVGRTHCFHRLCQAWDEFNGVIDEVRDVSTQTRIAGRSGVRLHVVEKAGDAISTGRGE